MPKKEAAKETAKKRVANKTAKIAAIELRGVWQNNLKGFDLDLPLGKLVVVTGLSGLGKSSLAFQTVYAEGQRCYMETFSPYTRQFFERMDKPQVDGVCGIVARIRVDAANPRSAKRSQPDSRKALSLDMQKAIVDAASSTSNPMIERSKPNFLKANSFWIAFIVAACTLYPALPSKAQAEEPEPFKLEVYREAFEKNNPAVSPGQEKLEASYATALENLLEEAQAEGNLDLALATEAEAKRFQKNKSGAVELSQHPRIAQRQKIFTEQTARIAQQWKLELIGSMRAYGKQLEELKIEFTKAGELSSAVAVQRERERVGRMIAAGAVPGGAKAVPGQLPDPDGKPADMRQKVKVFILLGQENMSGSGKVAGGDSKALEAASKNGRYPFLVDDQGAWTTRKDVRNVSVNNFKDRKNDWLTADDTEEIGPEIGFGSVVGEAFDAPVLILKSCNGNRSLGWDLLPPGSEQYEYNGKIYAGYKDSPASWKKGSKPKAIDWYAGKQYDADVGSAKQVLMRLNNYYPGARDYEIAGFVFWQGEKDRKQASYANRYEQNLVQFIKQLRKDFDAPNAKFVCATLGQTKKGAEGNDGKILEAQIAVDGERGKYKDFKGNVATVYANPLSQGGTSTKKYSANASVYMDVGVALGRAMLELLAE